METIATLFQHKIIGDLKLLKFYHEQHVEKLEKQLKKLENLKQNKRVVAGENPVVS